MSITTALKARRASLQDREAGFTLIELLVVVIIIGILAAIAIPIYLGVQNNAKESATKSDLTNDKTAVVGYAVDNNGSVPAAVADDAVGTVAGTVTLAKYGWSKSSNTSTLTYATAVPTGAAATAAVWCITGKSTTNTQFYISSNNPVTAGACPASTAW
jgi:type IV pilus assembly protein PilA